MEKLRHQSLMSALNNLNFLQSSDDLKPKSYSSFECSREESKLLTLVFVPASILLARARRRRAAAARARTLNEEPTSPVPDTSENNNTTTNVYRRNLMLPINLELKYRCINNNEKITTICKAKFCLNYGSTKKS